MDAQHRRDQLGHRFGMLGGRIGGAAVQPAAGLGHRNRG
jgi:hypothetical protein